MYFRIFPDSPTLKLTVGAVAISFSGVWVKIADVSPASSAFYRVFFGCVFLFLFSIQSKEKILPNKYHFLLGSFCGLLFALDLLCWHHSIHLIGPGLATLLGNFQVFILAGIGIVILKERFTKMLLISIPLAITGLYLIVGFDWFGMTPGYKRGISFGFATAVFYSAYILSLKILMSRSKESYYPMMLVSFTTSMIIGIYMIFSLQTFAIPDIKSFFSLAGLGFFSQCFGWLCIATSLPKIKTSYTGLILLLQPSLAFIWDVIFFARPTNFYNWIGVIITLISIYLGLKSKR